LIIYFNNFCSDKSSFPLRLANETIGVDSEMIKHIETFLEAAKEQVIFQFWTTLILPLEPYMTLSLLALFGNWDRGWGVTFFEIKTFDFINAFGNKRSFLRLGFKTRSFHLFKVHGLELKKQLFKENVIRRKRVRKVVKKFTYYLNGYKKLIFQVLHITELSFEFFAFCPNIFQFDL